MPKNDENLSIDEPSHPAMESAEGASLSFSNWVADRQANAGTRRKGEITRDRIRLATVEILNNMVYRDLTVSEICKHAKISPPVLYLYFDSKESLVQDVLREFIQDFIARTATEESRTPYQAMYAANLQWIKLVKANAGLMRCLLQFSEEQEDFGRFYVAENNRWNLRITQSILRRYPSAASEEDEIHFIVYSLSGMIDEVTRRLADEGEGPFAKLCMRIASSEDDLAGKLTTLWYRALYASDPPDADAPDMAPVLVKAARRRRAPRPTKAIS